MSKLKSILNVKPFVPILDEVQYKLMGNEIPINVYNIIQEANKKRDEVNEDHVQSFNCWGQKYILAKGKWIKDE